MDKGRILAIDDEEFFRHIYEEVLSSCGYFVATAENGRQGVDALKKERFDIVITDLTMPEWDGIRTMEEIRKVNPGQDIIVVTHTSDLETAAIAMRAGATDYILKPLLKANLIPTVRRLRKRQKILYEHTILVKESIEYFEILSIYKRCLDILSITEYERLVDSIIGALTAETRARKALFWLSEGGMEGNWKIVGSRGEIEPRDRELPVDDPSWEERVLGGTPFFKSADRKDVFYVPVMPADGDVGVIELSGKVKRGRFTAKDLKIAGLIAEFSQVALNNVQRLRSFEECAYMDEELGIFTHNFFVHFLKKEVFLSARYGRPFSLIYLKVNNVEELREKFGGDVTRAGISRMIRKVLDIIRTPDLMARKDLGEFYILLPETDYFGSLIAAKRIEKGVTGAKYVSDGEISMPVDLLIRSASFPRDGRDAGSLLDNVKREAEMSKKSPFHHLELSEKGLWECVDLLLSDAAKKMVAGGRKDGTGVAARHFAFPDSFYPRLRDSFVEEVLLRPSLRGILVLGMETVSPRADFCRKIAGMDNLATRTFVLGKRGKDAWNIPNITPVYLKENEEPLDILLFLNEQGGYAFLRRAEGGGESFHSSDLYLVEKLISKFQDHYLLQWI